MAPDNAPALDDFTDPADSDADNPVMPREMEDFAVPAAAVDAAPAIPIDATDDSDPGDAVDAAPVKAAIPPPPPTEAGMKILLDGFHAWLPLSSVVTVPLTVGFLPLPLRSLTSLTLAKGQWKFSEAGYITRS